MANEEITSLVSGDTSQAAEVSETQAQLDREVAQDIDTIKQHLETGGEYALPPSIGMTSLAIDGREIPYFGLSPALSATPPIRPRDADEAAQFVSPTHDETVWFDFIRRHTPPASLDADGKWSPSPRSFSRRDISVAGEVTYIDFAPLYLFQQHAGNEGPQALAASREQSAISGFTASDGSVWQLGRLQVVQQRTLNGKPLPANNPAQIEQNIRGSVANRYHGVALVQVKAPQPR